MAKSAGFVTWSSLHVASLCLMCKCNSSTVGGCNGSAPSVHQRGLGSPFNCCCKIHPISSQIFHPNGIPEWFKPGCCLKYPLSGSVAVVDALVWGLQKFGERLSLRSHVDKVIVENGRATGVKLRSGQFIGAKKAVVSNASMWDTLKILPRDVLPKSYIDGVNMTPQCDSFMHLHLGFDVENINQGINEDLGIHHIVVND